MKGRKPDDITEVDDLTEMPLPPDWLGEDARAEWNSVVPILFKRRHLSTTDLAQMASYCNARGRSVEMQKVLNKEGYIVQGPSGLKSHPAARLHKEADNMARLLAAELGLTPVSRGRGGPPESGGAGGDLFSRLGFQ